MPRDTYVTPRWVYEALYSVESWAEFAFDPAPADGSYDFLSDDIPVTRDIATNPPFSLADEFCRKATREAKRVAMLLPVNFDSAKGRTDLFADNYSFKAEYRLTTRIRWENLEQKKAGPSQNHSWFVWDRYHSWPPMKGWL